jgi:hypothetical protein
MNGIAEAIIEFFNQVVLVNVRVRFPSLKPKNYQLIPISVSNPATLSKESSFNLGIYHFNKAYDLLVEAASQETLRKCVDFINSPIIVSATKDCVHRCENLTSDWNTISLNLARMYKLFGKQSTSSNHQEALIKLVESCMHLANGSGYHIEANQLLEEMKHHYYSGLPPRYTTSAHNWGNPSESCGMSVVYHRCS